MRAKHRINNRFIALLLAAVTFLTSFNMLASVLPVVALGEETPITIRDDAMHFFFRHWHTDIDNDSVLNPGENQGNGQEGFEDFFVIVEGYIMPDDNGGYVCYAVNQGSDDYGELVPINDVIDSPYIKSFDKDTGTVVLNTKLLIDSDPDIDEPVERFSGISISAGHGAVTDYGEDAITIQYKDNIQLVKGHVFYQNKSKSVPGTYDKEKFADTGLFDDDEIDTAWAYTYKETNGTHKAGDLVMSESNSLQACTDLSDLPGGTTEDEVVLTKYYSTAPGLHTDKTVVQTTDGRTFLYDLEAWYTEGYGAQVGLVIDASGSMAFALDKPSVINVNDLGLSDTFAKKIGFVDTYNDFSRADDLIGYYQFQNQSQGSYRTWYLNSVKDPYQNYISEAYYKSSDKSYFAHSVQQADPTSGNIDFSKSAAMMLPSDFDSVFIDKVHTGWGDPMSMSASNGMYLTDTNSNSGFLLETHPEDPTDFTISFSLKQITTAACSSDIEIMYIGPEKVTDGNQNYFRVYRTNGDIVAEYGGSKIIRIANAFGTSEVTRIVSFTFGKNGITAYLDGKACATAEAISNLTAEVIVFDPFVDSNKQGQYFSVKDVYLFDAVLDADEVDALYQVAGNERYTDSVQKSASAFLNEAELALILNPHKTDNSLLGFADYSYFIYNPVKDTEAYSPIAYYANTTAANATYSKTNNMGGKGWYYISCSGSFTNGTSKQLYGLPTGSAFTDTIQGAVTVAETGKGAAPDMEEIIGNTGQKYTQSGTSPIKFYIDSEGNLRCFFAASGSTDNVRTSFVYELADEEYIRTEGLQRVLGSFANKLNDISPSAQLSAVQFSNGNGDRDFNDNGNEKLLLDWTSDVNRMTGLFKGNGTDNAKNEYGEYNYALTGGTKTDKGLEMFRDKLAGKDSKHDDDPDNDVAPRYLILFTDGAYTCTENELKKAANDLKSDEYDYTIFVVLLTDNEGETAEFQNLASISGSKDVAVNSTPGADNYGFGTDGKQYYFHINDLDELTHAFMTDILAQIVDDKGDYTVKDYIDPRFDLQTAAGEVWHLNAKGNVVIGEGDSAQTITVSKNSEDTFTLSGDTDISARNPYLRYDAANDMYYLEWVDQIIPTCGVSSDSLDVWIAQVWVRAKDDFIGGNAVLVGGNAEKMNWVYHPGDPDASSGTDDALQDFYKDADGNETEADPYRSKGFPRVVVNVALLPIYSNPLEDVIYLGEAVSPEQILTEIKDNFMTETYYLEYLKRFAYARYDVGENKPLLKEEMDRPLLDLLTEWLEFGNENEDIKAFSVPYMYLPAVEWDEESGKIALNEDGTARTIYNNAGTVINQRCIVGVLTYRWEQQDPTPLAAYEPVKDYVKTDTDRIRYALTVEFTPLRVGDSYELFYGNNDDNANGEESETAEILTTAEGYPIVSVSEINGVNVDPYTYAETGIFEKYLRIDDNHKAEVQADTRLDREKYINGNLDKDGNIIEAGQEGADHRGSYALISDKAYKWNKNFKPAVGAQELVDVTDLEEYPYGDALLINPYGTTKDNNPDYRTLKAGTTYTADVVSGGIELELKLLIGELKEAAAANGDFKYSFTVPATRSFRDTVFIEDLKESKYTEEDGSSAWEDYGEDFAITFAFDYDADAIAILEEDMEERPEKYPDGYVTIYAKATDIKAVNNTFSEDKNYSRTELPIGTYVIELDDINDKLPDNLHFATVEVDNENDLLPGYFQQDVLNGLHTTKNGAEEEWNGSEKRDATTGKVIENEVYEEGEAEITEDNIDGFRATGTTASDKLLVTFYIGTAVPDADSTEPYEPVRGDVTQDNPYIFDEANYINKRLGMLRLSTGMTLLTIEEIGGQSNESFLYRITGTTLGGKPVDITVSVNGDAAKGERSTTIVIPPGEYTVTEISDWSWRYKNVETYGKYDADTDENLHEDWKIGKIYKNGVLVEGDALLNASASMRYRDDLPENSNHKTSEEHKTVVYEHERNEKVWLGGENHLNNHFAGVQ